LTSLPSAFTGTGKGEGYTFLQVVAFFFGLSYERQREGKKGRREEEDKRKRGEGATCQAITSFPHAVRLLFEREREGGGRVDYLEWEGFTPRQCSSLLHNFKER